MKADIKVGGKLPDFELPDHQGRLVKLSELTAPTVYDRMMGFDDGYPLVVVFYRGFFCPRDGAQMRRLVRFQEELAVNYGRLVAISADAPQVCAAYRAGLGASFPFLSDANREAIDRLGIRDETETEYPGCAIPTTFVLAPDLTISKVYDGWFFVGRPTLEELRMDLRALMARLSNYSYEAYNQAAIKSSLRIPAERWQAGAPPPGQSGQPVARGVVEWFDLDRGYGFIRGDDGGRVFMHFSAIPGRGYRTLPAGAEVEFEVVTGPRGDLCAYNIYVIAKGEES